MRQLDSNLVRQRQGGFTLVELLIVVIIVAILAAIVIPQFTTSTDDAKLAALDGNLRNLRSAVDIYYQQHGEYPSKNGDGTNAADSPLAFVEQLTKYTDDEGDVAVTKDATHIYGPYLKRSTLPPDPFKQVTTVEISTTGTLPLTATGGDPGGWKFDNVSGQLVVNHTAYDDR